MGCFESKNNKNKAKPVKLPKFSFGQFNLKWTKILQVKILDSIIVNQVNIQHPCFKSIEKDVNRTFPNQVFFQNQQNIHLFSQTLKCFALTFPKIGYTQGLNFLCGYFLLNKMNQVQCLKVLGSSVIHPKLMLMGLYEDGFPLVELYCKLFWKLLQKIDNQVYLFLRRMDVADHMWIFQWYLTLFLYSFPIEYVTLFLNKVFGQKQFEIVKISVGLVLCLREGILGLQHRDQVYFIEFLDGLKRSQTCSKLIDIDLILRTVQSIDDSMVNQGLQEIKKSSHLNQNFYLNYFSSPQKQKSLYEQFLVKIKEGKVSLQQSRHDSRLMQSYKRNRETVEILDEILLQSLNKQMKKKYKSDLFEIRNKNKYEINQFRKCRSLARLDQEPQKQGEGETTVSIVKKVLISQESQEQNQ